VRHSAHEAGASGGDVFRHRVRLVCNVNPDPAFLQPLRLSELLRGRLQGTSHSPVPSAPILSTESADIAIALAANQTGYAKVSSPFG
jgi:hypothetical protein